MSFDANTALFTLGGVALGATASIVSGYLPGRLLRKAQAEEKLDQQRRVAAFYRGLVTETATASLGAKSTDLMTRSAILTEISVPLLAAVNNSAFLSQLSPNGITVVMIVATLMRGLTLVYNQAVEAVKDTPELHAYRKTELDAFLVALKDNCATAIAVLNETIQDGAFGEGILETVRRGDGANQPTPNTTSKQ